MEQLLALQPDTWSLGVIKACCDFRARKAAANAAAPQQAGSWGKLKVLAYFLHIFSTFFALTFCDA